MNLGWQLERQQALKPSHQRMNGKDMDDQSIEIF
jgi:hypothetical protein